MIFSLGLLRLVNAHNLLRQGCDAHLECETGNAAYRVVHAQDFFCDGFRISYEQRSGRSELGVEMCASDWRPAAFLPDLRKTSRITGKEFVCRLCRTVGDIAKRMNADLELIWSVSRAQ